MGLFFSETTSPNDGVFWSEPYVMGRSFRLTTSPNDTGNVLFVDGEVVIVTVSGCCCWWCDDCDSGGGCNRAPDCDEWFTNGSVDWFADTWVTFVVAVSTVTISEASSAAGCCADRRPDRTISLFRTFSTPTRRIALPLSPTRLRGVCRRIWFIFIAILEVWKAVHDIIIIIIIVIISTAKLLTAASYRLLCRFTFNKRWLILRLTMRCWRGRFRLLGMLEYTVKRYCCSLCCVILTECYLRFDSRWSYTDIPQTIIR